MFGLLRHVVPTVRSSLFGHSTARATPLQTTTAAFPSANTLLDMARPTLQPVRCAETWRGGGGKLGTSRKRKRSFWTPLKPGKFSQVKAVTCRFLPTGDGQYMRWARNIKGSADRKPEYKERLKHIKYLTASQVKSIDKMYGPVKKFRTTPPHAHTKIISTEGRRVKGKLYLR